MNFNIEFERIYPHPVEKVWRAISDSGLLGKWLMDNDFAAEKGREFRLWCTNDAGDIDTYLCRVVEIDPPNHMVWSWVLEGREADGLTMVEFNLEPVAEGTRLTLRHSGDRDRKTIDMFKQGWPARLVEMADMLAGEK